LYACANNAVESILILLDDARVNINCCNNSGFTALIYAVEYGFISPIEHILASLRHIQSSDITNTIIEAKKESILFREAAYPNIVKLLKAYQTRPFNTVKDLRNKLKLKGLIIFYFISISSIYNNQKKK